MLDEEIIRVSDMYYVACSLKAVDTIGNCQKLAFTFGVSQHTAYPKKTEKI